MNRQLESKNIAFNRVNILNLVTSMIRKESYWKKKLNMIEQTFRTERGWGKFK